MKIHQQKIIAAAKDLGITVEDLSEKWQTEVVKLSWGTQEELVFAGVVFSSLTFQAHFIAENKQLGKEVMASLGLPVLPGLILKKDRIDQAEVEAFLDQHGAIVCKPLAGTNGEGVGMDLGTVQAVMDHCAHLAEFTDRFLLEKQAVGKDLRLQAIGGHLVAACERVPTTITGDGRQTVRQLISQKASDAAANNPENTVLIDQQVLDLLNAKGFSLNSIPAIGRVVQIKKVANMAQGATAVDVTDKLHSRYGVWIEHIAAALNLPLFSLDLMVENFYDEPQEKASILEINAQPAWAHHTFSERRTHDIPRMILEDLFGMGDVK